MTVPRTLLTNVAYFLVVFSRPVDIYRAREKRLVAQLMSPSTSRLLGTVQRRKDYLLSELEHTRSLRFLPRLKLSSGVVVAPNI